ncbi:MAG TPA: YkgJ family cysteine cluster protein [Candidatus Lokiarchaeia archaeon]|nr:YkgJ family cysteine cluster protein [Candidatus Lokiarchaeia archaeon]
MSKVIKSRRGVRFNCNGCGRCCSGESDGHVFVYGEEIKPITDYLHLTESEFVNRYCEVYDDIYEGDLIQTLVIKLNSDSGNCIFLQDDMKCRIYPNRPFQCLSFPFWRMNMENRDVWARVKENCSGFATHFRGHFYTLNEIETFLHKERQLEEDHYNLLKQNNFRLAVVYHCLEKKSPLAGMAEEREQKQPGPILRHPRASLAGHPADS